MSQERIATGGSRTQKSASRPLTPPSPQGRGEERDVMLETTVDANGTTLKLPLLGERAGVRGRAKQRWSPKVGGYRSEPRLVLATRQSALYLFLAEAYGLVPSACAERRA